MAHRDMDLEAVEKFRLGPWIRDQLPPELTAAKSIDHEYPDIVRCVVKRRRVEHVQDMASYGQGFASYSHHWFYRDIQEFRRPLLDREDWRFACVWVYMCRGLPCCVMGEDERGSSSFSLPGLEGVDEFRTSAVRDLAAHLASDLLKFGIVRLSKNQLAMPLPSDVYIESNLAGDRLCVFDALFFWYD